MQIFTFSETWGDPKYYSKYPIIRVFMFGHQDFRETYLEHQEFNDCLMGDFRDTFQNLTFKDSMVFTWAHKHCKADYIIKADDDCFFNPWLGCAKFDNFGSL